MTSVLAIVATGCCVAACFTAMQFVVSMLMFRRAPRVPQQLSASAVEDNSGVPAVSVLIPARNEAERISKLLQSVLSSRGVQLEVCVLDDESTDGTAEIVESFVAADSRVRLLRGGGCRMAGMASSMPAGNCLRRPVMANWCFWMPMWNWRVTPCCELSCCGGIWGCRC